MISLVNILELIAAFSGFYYLKKNKNSKLRYFVYFLVITVCVDALGWYTSFLDKFEFLKRLKETRFETNFWLFNTFIIGSLFFYISFYKNILSIKNNTKLLKTLLIISVLVVFFNIYVAGSSYFETNLKYNFIWTTFCVFICVSLYFYELLISDKILVFYKSSLFYISIGLLLWWLVFPPMIFYMPYYKKIYPEVVRLREIILLVLNIYLYSCYIIGFLWGKE
jgi:hypothetical protein